MPGPPVLTAYLPRAKHKYQHRPVSNRFRVSDHWTDLAAAPGGPRPTACPFSLGIRALVCLKQHTASCFGVSQTPASHVWDFPLSPSFQFPFSSGRKRWSCGSLSCQTANPSWASQMWEVQQRQQQPSALVQALQSRAQVDILNKYNWHMIYRLHPFWRQVLYWDEDS